MKATYLHRMLIGALVTSILSAGTPAVAEQTEIYNKTWLDQRYDWVLFMNLKTLKSYLSYSGSQVGPVVDIKVSYHVTPRLAANHEDTVLPYEDLWYHNGQPLGLRRYRTLPFKTGWQGAICLSDSDDIHENTTAVANVVVRLLLDVGLKDCEGTAALMPPNILPVIKSDLGRFNFDETQDNSLSDNSVIHLLLSSGNPKDSIFLIYRPPH